MIAASIASAIALIIVSAAMYARGLKDGYELGIRQARSRFGHEVKRRNILGIPMEAK